MNSEIAIQVSRVTKRFRVYDNPQIRIGALFHKYQYKEFAALDDVSFTVRKGETVGIIGKNGSGKSTLLQIVSGILAPTTGTATARGRVAALLELGSGFNPELSGRENVYINAAILGLSTKEISARLASIEAFADIGEFIDRPIKSYSSGMAIRLAFSVAVAVDPQILIVDEAIAVGDELFQRKCYSRIERMKEDGTTILFVSHSGNAVVSLCDRAILLDSGKKLAEGATKVVLGKYHQLLNASTEKAEQLRQRLFAAVEQQDVRVAPAGQKVGGVRPKGYDYFDPLLVSSCAYAYEPQGAIISSPALYNSAGEKVNCLSTGESYKYTYQVRFYQAANHVRFGMLIRTVSGVELGGGSSANQIADGIPKVGADSEMTVECTFLCRLQEGIYYLNAGVSGDCGNGFRHLHRITDGLCFRVNPAFDAYHIAPVDFSPGQDSVDLYSLC